MSLMARQPGCRLRDEQHGLAAGSRLWRIGEWSRNSLHPAMSYVSMGTDVSQRRKGPRPE